MCKKNAGFMLGVALTTVGLTMLGITNSPNSDHPKKNTMFYIANTGYGLMALFGIMIMVASQKNNSSSINNQQALMSAGRSRPNANYDAALTPGLNCV